MTKTTPMMPPIYDFGAMVDFWHRQSNAMVTFNLQMMRAAMAPWEAMGLSPRAFVNLGMVPSAVAATEAAMTPAAEPSQDEPLPVETDAKADATPTARTAANDSGAAPKKATAAVAETAQAAEDAATARKPSGLKAPRAVGADDLRRITGLGPKLQEALNAIGIYHFDQVAKWTEAETAWIDENIGGVRGRASRDGWAKQAATLARGDKG
ncbi:hypothetical protein [Citreimonas sp.]|uniref:hypothetical protein n=1 Tax=Citreimonas sp. TaxID=3036715 RepID=UPI0035C82BA0